MPGGVKPVDVYVMVAIARRSAWPYVAGQYSGLPGRLL